MNLTNEEQRAVEGGRAVPVTIGQAECVVVRKDVYERTLVDVSPRQTYPSVLRAIDKDDKNTEQYLEYLDGQS